ncbi:MAG TPA: hypothetical protein VF184_01425 [Phycisphaeraceae bacterium]
MMQVMSMWVLAHTDMPMVVGMALVAAAVGFVVGRWVERRRPADRRQEER